MKKIITIFVISFFLITISRAQWITIPDPNFVTFLQSHYPGCMNGNQLNTTCSEITNETILNLNSLSLTNISGVQYFTGLYSLTCSNNQLTNIQQLPSSLTSFDCRHNQIQSLPSSLPPNLYLIDCSVNQLGYLPTLPNGLQILICDHNSLTSLPVLPQSILNVLCGYNQLTVLPVLPNNLLSLDCRHNQIIGIPNWPNNLQNLNCVNNQIFCFTPIPDYALINGTSFTFLADTNLYTCLPNYISSMSPSLLTFPLCDYFNPYTNPNNCNPGNGIFGHIYQDINSDCNIQNGEAGVKNVPLKRFDSAGNLISQTISSHPGDFYFSYYGINNAVVIDTIGKDFKLNCITPGETYPIIYNPLDSIITDINFGVGCKPGFDVGIQSAGHTGVAFPNLTHQLNILASSHLNWYNLNCPYYNTFGEITVNVTGPVSYEGMSVGALTPIINGNTFTFQIPNFDLLNSNSLGIKLKVDSLAQVGDQICITLSVTPTLGDNQPSNNYYSYCYDVVNSMDPNYKEVYPENVGSGYNNWLTYTIHFQNTGNAPAMNIRLMDTLDTNLDLNTFEVINYSHDLKTDLTGRFLRFIFPNIQLPDSTSDPEGSQGFVQYRIKPKANLPFGTQISNTAYIFFDYNEPIITNTALTEFNVNEVGTEPFSQNKMELTLYPNPTDGKINIETSLNKATFEIVDITGTLVRKGNLNGKLTQLNFDGLASGVYFFKLYSETGFVTRKLVKK